MSQLKSTLSAAVAGSLVTAACFVGTSLDLGHESHRSSQWPTVRAEHLEKFPACRVCGSRKNVEVHHKEPFHLHPEKELDPKNLITLCSNPNCKSHLTIGHLGNYQLSNPHVDEDTDLLSKRRREARE